MDRILGPVPGPKQRAQDLDLKSGPWVQKWAQRHTKGPKTMSAPDSPKAKFPRHNLDPGPKKGLWAQKRAQKGSLGPKKDAWSPVEGGSGVGAA